MAEPAEQRTQSNAAYHTADTDTSSRATRYAVRMTLSGQVQGVGFRPFVYRLAHEYGLHGYVQNRLGEVDIVASGRHPVLQQFRHDLIERAPPLAKPTIAKLMPIETAPFHGFEIVPSSPQADARVYVPPDYFMCEDCRRELHDPRDRRHGYPFINCTQCGPRYTLIESLPYDRPNTSMREFPLCIECEAEYSDPADRRFHAEPIACPACGPRLSFVQPDSATSADVPLPLDAALELFRNGKVVAVKGIGGYHLMCDACDVDAVAALRRRKQRPTKPLAVMFPTTGSDDLDTVRQHAYLQAVEAELLTSPPRPIVLTAKRRSSNLADNIAPGLAEFGIFLPYSPLHQILLEKFGGPMVATSGNISGEPVLTVNDEAQRRLTNVADGFLHHDRRIVRPADDPVYRRIAATMRPLRLGRGSAPREMELPWRQRKPVLAVGGQMKGAVALGWDDRVIVSPHIGEMDSPRSLQVFAQVAADLQSLYGIQAERVICDAHPGYTTHRWAQQQPLPVETVWHHQAHASALAAEVALPGRWLVFTWDGVGLGEDGTLWGGEAMVGKPGNWQRVGSLRPFRLPGGDRAGREPWRSAAALHWECGKDWPDCPDKDGLARTAWEADLNCPQTSAAGRLFDAAAALIAGQTHVSFEAQGPMYLESLCQKRAEPVYLSFFRDTNRVWRCDWGPLLAMMTNARLSPQTRAEMFHASLANVLLRQARRIRDEYSVDMLGLCGGVFQNRVLTEHAVELLERKGFRVFLPSQLPGNDAALCFGQAAELAARER